MDVSGKVGEFQVDSAKKFIKAAKDDTKLTPVLFSDLRIRAGIPRFPARQTFVRCGEVTISALKSCFIDKTKVALSAKNGNDLWPALPDGGLLSTGLNVVIGARSSGKTHLLQGLKESTENALLIPQFSLVNESESQYLEHLERTRTTYADDYLLGLKRVLDAVMAVDLDANARELDEYLRTLLRAADEADRRDALSRASLFSAEEFSPVDDQTLIKLVESVRQVIENLEFKHIVEKYVDVQSLKRLACELIELLWERQGVSVHKQLANEIISDAKRGLRIRTSATQVAEIDLYKHAMDDHRVARFRELASSLKERAVIHEKTLQGFRIQAIREPFAGALEVRAASCTKLAFGSAFKQYEDPYLYLRELLEIGGLARADLYKLFIKISYRILNRDGYEVSGGERSEFRLLQAIGDAQNFELLLVDEPESSFDNLFLKREVNSLLKQISTTMPVVVVTHNSTLGASANADYLLRTTKTLEDGNIRYRVYGGYPTDRILRSTDGTEIGCFESLVTTLEAGEDAYLSRRELYEAAKDRE